MPFYNPPSNPSRRATGDVGVGSLPTVRLETELPNDYELERLGIHSESATAAPLNRGELTSLNAGDYERSIRTVSTATGSYEVVVTSRALTDEDEGRVDHTAAIDDGSADVSFSDSYSADREATLGDLAEAAGYSPPESVAYSDPEPEHFSETDYYAAPEATGFSEEVAPADSSDYTYTEPAYEEPSAAESAFADAVAGWEAQEADD